MRSSIVAKQCYRHGDRTIVFFLLWEEAEECIFEHRRTAPKRLVLVLLLILLSDALLEKVCLMCLHNGFFPSFIRFFLLLTACSFENH